jgi:hypothetical protein
MGSAHSRIRYSHALMNSVIGLVSGVEKTRRRQVRLRKYLPSSSLPICATYRRTPSLRLALHSTRWTEFCLSATGSYNPDSGGRRLLKPYEVEVEALDVSLVDEGWRHGCKPAADGSLALGYR